MNPTGGVNVTPSMLDVVRVTRESFAVLVVTCGVGSERAALSSLFALDQPPPPVLSKFPSAKGGVLVAVFHQNSPCMRGSVFQFPRYWTWVNPLGPLIPTAITEIEIVTPAGLP